MRRETEPQHIADSLRNNRDLMHVLDALPACVSYIDTDERYRLSNKAHEEWFGLSGSDVYGEHVREVVGEDAYRKAKPFLAEVLSGKKISCDIEMPYKHGGTRYVSMTLVPHFGDDEKVAGIIVFVSDITGLKRAEKEIRENEERLRRLLDERTDAFRESEDKFRAMSAAAGDAIMMMDDDGKVTYLNRAAEKMFGYSEEELLGKDLHATLAPRRYRSDIKSALGHFKETGQGSAIGKSVEMKALKKDGSEFPIELTLSGVQMKGVWVAIGIVRDITERKAMESEFKKKIDELERFMKVTMDREKRIIELKREIKLLKGESDEGAKGR